LSLLLSVGSCSCLVSEGRACGPPPDSAADDAAAGIAADAAGADGAAAGWKVAVAGCDSEAGCNGGARFLS